MPQESQLAHRVITNTALPYVTNVSPISTDPHYTLGSQDILTTVNGYAERRPGFATNVETIPTVFNNLKRLFTWDRFDGSFYKIACDVNASGFAQVYKLAVGIDASFSSIFTDTISTPFDFVVSNNTLYFSNGHVAKKWDPVNGVSNWGISIGSVNNAIGPNACGTGTDVAYSGGTPWANPGNITAQDGVFSTVTVAAGGATQSTGYKGPGAGTGWVNSSRITANDGSYATVVLTHGTTSAALKATSFGFSVPSNANISGISVTITHGDMTGLGSLNDATVKLLKAGVAVGNNEAQGQGWGGPPETFFYGGSSDLWGTTWTPNDINNANFGVELQAINNDPSGTGTAGCDYITISVSYSVPVGATYSDYLEGTNFGFAIPGTNTILGILVEVKGFQSQIANATLQATILKAGNLIGTTKTGMQLPSLNGFISFGGNGDLWGTMWTFNDINQANFGVALQAVNASNSSASWSVDFVRITIFGLGGPTVVVSGSAGTMNATAGYTYVFCYGNSNTGHISSPTPPSSTTGVFTNKLKVTISLTASTDAQVNQIRLFRTTDGGGGTYFELPNSPFPNSTANVDDNAADAALQVGSIAPTPTFNDPPTPIQGMVYFSGRIWGFTGNKVWFSGLEEINQGVPEEAWPSGIAGNFWSFDEPVQGIGIAGGVNNQVLAIFCGGRIYGISGNTLDTFRRFLVSARRGARNLTCVSMLGGMTAWLDSANQVWASDGNTLQEVSQDIRPDLLNISQANCCLTFHTQGRFHWLILSTGTKLYVYDIDLQQWMPPWTFSCNYLFSGEISAGNYVLMAATNTKALQLSTISFNDNGVTYTPVLKTSLMSVVPDYGSRFSYIGMGSYNEPTRTGWPDTFQITNNGFALADVLILKDEDPTISTYTSIASSVQDTSTAYNRVNGINLKQWVYKDISSASRWISLQVRLAAVDQADKVYEMFMAYKGLGGR